MLSYMYNNFLSRKQKNRLKRNYYKTNKIITDIFFKYNEIELKKCLVQLGIGKDDTILLHSSFDYFNGFQGKAQDIIKILFDLLGSKGNLLMVSMPYTCSTSEYLQKDPIFNVRKTPSRMGIISEIFRRKKGVLRSLHPSHPILAYGKDAAWVVRGHEKCISPCGKDTPFDKFRSLNGKVLFFDVPFHTFTFLHYLEDLIKDNLPFPIYTEEPFAVKVIDYNGKELDMQTYAFSDTAVKTRKPEILEKNLLKEDLLIKKRIGKTKLMIVSAEDAVLCAQRMMKNNIYFFTQESSR